MTVGALFHLPFPVHATHPVDDRDVPVAGIDFTILDPSGNALGFKAFADLSQVFAK